MRHDSRPTTRKPRVLATDLDGTFIPLPDHQPSRRDLDVFRRELAAKSIELAFVTGRHLAIVVEAIAQHRLPTPEWIICDVGTSIYQQSEQGWQLSTAYQAHLAAICQSLPIAELRNQLTVLSATLTPQEGEKQGPFKLSFYADAAQLDAMSSTIDAWIENHGAPYSRISSVDPFTGDGLIDLLPVNVSKAYAVEWWRAAHDFAKDEIIFAGDSGNDLAALTAGYRAIVVGNADRQLAADVEAHYQAEGWVDRLHLAAAPSTSGVLEGCRVHGLIAAAPRQLALGANLLSESQTAFAVWAPLRKRVDVLIEADSEPAVHPLEAIGAGYHQAVIDGVGPGARYSYRLDEELQRPDPLSRFQPAGVHGPSQVIDPGAYVWRDNEWGGVPKSELIIYELHVGTFTEGGTFEAAIGRLQELRELGVTAVELLPVAESPGRWNWGYDGVGLFAVSRNYGTPDDFRAFVDAAHAAGLAVILDVVYNHVGPEGNYLADFGPYFSTIHHTPWGETFDFDSPDCAPVREFIVENALRWFREYHLDGLRLDAVHSMIDDSDESIFSAIRAAVDDYAAGISRDLHLIAETNVHDDTFLRQIADGPKPYDAIWCDDIMHALHSHVAPQHKHVRRDYAGAADLAESLQHGFLYSGRDEARMSPAMHSGRKPDATVDERASFVVALQNHDIVGNDPGGRRFHQLTTPDTQKAAAALVLLYPAIPLLFMGEEFAAVSPFRFFVDFEDERLREAVELGRAREYPEHLVTDAVSPIDPLAFTQSALQAAGDTSMRDWYKSLISVRKSWQAAGVLTPNRLTVDCLPDDGVFTLRFTDDGGLSRFVIVRLQAETTRTDAFQCHITGELLLDSQRPEWKRQPHSEDIPLRGDRALIGVGTFSLHSE